MPMFHNMFPVSSRTFFTNISRFDACVHAIHLYRAFSSNTSRFYACGHSYAVNYNVAGFLMAPILYKITNHPTPISGVFCNLYLSPNKVDGGGLWCRLGCPSVRRLRAVRIFVSGADLGNPWAISFILHTHRGCRCAFWELSVVPKWICPEKSEYRPLLILICLISDKPFQITKPLL